MTTPNPICEECVWLYSGENWPLKCAAFPEGVPDEIAIGYNDHSKPVEGDHGFRFEPREGEDGKGE